MTVFTGKHDEELAEYFSGVLKGKCGLRSSMGGQLDALASAALHPIPRNGSFMAVKPEDRHANRDFTMTDDMREAVRALDRMESVLEHLDRAHLPILRAHYEEPSKARYRKLVVVLGSEEEAIDLVKRSVSEDRSIRRDGRKSVGSAEYRAQVALKAAQEAYAIADEQKRLADIQRRKDAFRERLA